MDKFVIRKKARTQGGPSESGPNFCNATSQNEEQVDLQNLPVDPGERKRISDYPSKIQKAVKQKYIDIGPIQPRKHNFPQKMIGTKLRRFNPDWYDDYSNWLEYSIKKDALFCLPCYLFKPEGNKGGGDAFVVSGFSSWNKKDRLDLHIGDLENSHNKAVEQYENLKNIKASIEIAFNPPQTPQMKNDYKTRLKTSVICVRYLLRMGLPFRGHDESDESNNRENFIELVKVAASLNTDIDNVVLKNAPGNLQMLAPSIQKDIVKACAVECAVETTKVIIEELGDDLFGILVDESSDVSTKEQLAVVLRFVNDRGFLIERFLGVVHVANTCSISLKSAVESLLLEHGLSLSRIRGQGYDGASNMRGEFGGLKSLILKENKSAHYVHCFAHQLQLTLVGTAKNHVDVIWFFDVVSDIINVIGSSCKRRDVLREMCAMRLAEAINNGEIKTGKGLNQELGLKRPGDTRWGSHYRSLLNLVEMYPDLIEVLDFIYNDASFSDILGITNELSLALQREDQDIVNAMHLVETSKKRLQLLRDDEFEELLEKVYQYCYGHDIDIPKMDDIYVTPGRSKRRAPQISFAHHYRVEVFYAIIDLQLQELNTRFNEINTELLLYVACLSPLLA
ncbi:uncharacterized protein LOC104893834 [Beta vulgaris subsp. vulgaris]|uniref:uncharacterized protein LOC104893834 n=1 Tax=Beta vulgaris subsp. vulgaris TaxID=3555 RepID=UPI002547030F|nr:uncharacterized protein LOC104893834 [Beta vulgaris subsp. vulgaris]